MVTDLWKKGVQVWKIAGIYANSIFWDLSVSALLYVSSHINK